MSVRTKILRLYFFAILSFVFSVGKAQSDSISLNRKKQVEEFRKRFEIPDSDTLWKTKSLEGKWIYLSESVSGCLQGSQYCHELKCENMRSCFDFNPYWIDFLKFNKDSLTIFLISKLADYYNN